MLCDICGKKEATVHLTEIINDKVTKLHICEQCAKEKGAEMEEHFGLNDLLAGLTDLGSGIETDLVGAATCPSCGFTYADFKKVGRLGCSECYEVFKKQLEPLLKRIHGANRHIGKVPLRVGKTVQDTQTIHQMKLQLNKAIQAEEFEKAAAIRDKLRELESKGKDTAAGGSGAS